MMLTIASLRNDGIPDELANRMMVAHGSRMLLRTLRGEPAPIERPVYIPSARPKLPKPRAYHPVRMRNRPHMPETVKRIVEAVAAHFEVTVEELTGPARQPYLVHARAVAYHLLRDRVDGFGQPRMSLPRIAAFFGRDHSTICYAIDHFDIYCRHPHVAEAYAKLREVGE